MTLVFLLIFNETYQPTAGQLDVVGSLKRTSLRTGRNINIVVSSTVMTDVLDGGGERRNHIGIEWTRHLSNIKSALQVVGLGFSAFIRTAVETFER